MSGHTGILETDIMCFSIPSPKSKRQEIIDIFTDSGITIGEVSEKLGVSTDVVSSVIFLNIGTYTYLPKESK